MLKIGVTSSGRAVVLQDANNPHIFVSGQSGSGKSYFMRKMAIQAVQQGTLCVVLDYSGDFSAFRPPDGLSFQQIDVTSAGFSLNPLAGAQNVDERVQRLMGLIHSGFCMGVRATASLRKAAMEYLAEDDSPTIRGLLDYVQSMKSRGRGLSSALEPLELVASLIHDGSQHIGLDLHAPGLVVLDFRRIADNLLQKILVEMILRSIWDSRISEQYASLHPLVLFLDEAQNLAWGQESMSTRILREGRKFSIGGWFGTQWITNKDAISALGQAAVQCHFRPDDQHVDHLARMLCHVDPSEHKRYRQLVRNLRRGQFLWQQPDGRVVLVRVET